MDGGRAAMRNGNVLGFARVIGMAAVLLAACGGDDESPAPADAGGSGGTGGSGGSGTGGGGGDSGSSGLGDDVAGKPCTTSADCGGATCATQIAGTMLGSTLTAPGGYCTGNCTDDTACGEGGACIGAIPMLAEGQCLAECAA